MAHCYYTGSPIRQHLLEDTTAHARQRVRKLDAATKAKVEDIRVTLPEGKFSSKFLAACLAAYGGDEIALMADLLDGALPLKLKKLYLRIGSDNPQGHVKPVTGDARAAWFRDAGVYVAGKSFWF